jgi:hypothetical protein
MSESLKKKLKTIFIDAGIERREDISPIFSDIDDAEMLIRDIYSLVEND